MMSSNTSGVTARSILRRFRNPLLSRFKNAVLSWHFRRRHTGAGSYVDGSAHVLGWRCVRIGKNSVVSADCWFNVNDRSSAATQISVGDFCHLGRRNLLSSGQVLRLGDYCLTGPDCRFLGSDHIFDDPFLPYVASGAKQVAVMEVGPNCWFGAGAVVMGNVKIGHGSVIGALTLVTKDIPPFSLVVGNPARVIKRYSMSKQAWVPAQALPPQEEQALPGEETYLEILRKSRSSITMPVAAASKRMGDLP
jgi:acetyltransferase-like isoleucine patch superfamily enzyme